MLELPFYAPKSQGGQGELTPLEPSRRPDESVSPESFTPPDLSRADTRLIGDAIRGRWPISPRNRKFLVETLAFIIENPDRFDTRIVVNASQALLNADKLNMEQEARDMGVKKPVAIEANGRSRLDFSKFSDEELERYLEGGGRG